MKLYRIYTENTPKAKQEVAKIMADCQVDSYTLLTGIGYWKGKEERSLIIELLAEPEAYPIQHITRRVKEVLKQEAVLATRQDVDTYLA